MAPIITLFDEDEEYIPSTYRAPRGVVHMHQYPRWGWPSDPVYLKADATSDEKQGYLTGILIGSLIIFMIFIVWSLILICLKCCGRPRVGCASGSAPVKPDRPSLPTDADASHSDAMQRSRMESFRRSMAALEAAAAARAEAEGGGDEEDIPTSVHEEDIPASVHEEEIPASVHEEDIPASVQRWLESEKQKEESAMEEAESEILKSARAGGALMAARSTSQEDVNIIQSKQQQQQEEEEQDQQSEEKQPPKEHAPQQRTVSFRDDAAHDDEDAPESDGDNTGITPNAENVSAEVRKSQYNQQREESQNYVASMRKFNRRVRIIRTIFLLAGVGILISTALFYAKGLIKLKNSLEETQNTLTYGESILDELHGLTSSYLNTRKDVQEEVDNMRYSSEEFCPTRNLDSLQEQLGLTPNQTAPLRELVEDIGDSFGKLGDMLVSEFESLDDDLTNIMGDVAAANDALDNAYPFLWAGVGVVAVQILITLCMLVDVIMVSRGQKMQSWFVKCMRNTVILPLFFLFTFLAWLFASLFLFAAISGSDFCVEPDANIMTYLNGKVEKGEMSPVLLDYLVYFLGCEESAKPVAIPEEAGLIYDAIGVVHNFTEYLASEESVATEVCSTIGADLIQSLSEIVHTELHEIGRLFDGVIQLMRCDTFNPLYSTATYNALCINGVDGLNWMFGTQLAIAICSMTMITLRAARHDSTEMHGETRDLKRELSRKLNIGAKPAPWEAAAVAAFMAADEQPDVQEQKEQADEENGPQEDEVYPEGEEYYYEGEEGPDDWGEAGPADENVRGEYYHEEEPDEDENEQDVQGEYGEGDWGESGPADEQEDEYYQEKEPYEPTPAGSVDSQSGAEESVSSNDEHQQERDANFEVLETLTSDQVEAIEMIGVRQAESGHKYEKDELQVELLSIPGLSDEQINAVIELELLTRH